VSFATITLYVSSQQVFVIVYFVIDSVWKLLDTPSYLCSNFERLILFRTLLAIIHFYLQFLYDSHFTVMQKILSCSLTTIYCSTSFSPGITQSV
jgi:hypothetical protein